MKTSDRTPAPVRRAKLRVEVAESLRATLGEQNVDQADIAVVTGAKPHIVQRWCDVGREETISLADVVGSGHSYPEVARALLAWAAGKLGFEVIVKRDAESAADVLGHLGAVTHAAPDLQHALLDALSPSSEDGAALSDGERRRIAARAAVVARVATEIECAMLRGLTGAAGAADTCRGARDGHTH